MHFNRRYINLLKTYLLITLFKKLFFLNSVHNKKLAIILVIPVLLTLQSCAAIVVASVAGGLTLAQDKREMKTILDDQSIEYYISNELSKDKELKTNSHISIISYNAVVLLTGETPDANMRARMVDIAKKSNKVTRVYNALYIMEPTSLKSRNNDTWITTKVKTQLLGKKEINGLHIKVITENAVVYLMGLIPQQHADLAANTASEISGVKRVIKVFEYVD